MVENDIARGKVLSKPMVPVVTGWTKRRALMMRTAWDLGTDSRYLDL
jgi:hypothetical protein